MSQARNVGLEMAPSGIVVGNIIQAADRSIRIVVRLSKTATKPATAPSTKAGAVACDITCDSAAASGGTMRTFTSLREAASDRSRGRNLRMSERAKTAATIGAARGQIEVEARDTLRSFYQPAADIGQGTVRQQFRPRAHTDHQCASRQCLRGHARRPDDGKPGLGRLMIVVP